MNNKYLDGIVEIKHSDLEWFFSANTLGVCIPAYQRHFSWDRSNFVRFLDDIINDMLEKEPFTFLGSIIYYKGELPSPLKGKPPDNVYMIVDGQQRLSLIAALAVLLHSQICNEWQAVKSTGNDWLDQEANRTQPMLQNIFSISRGGQPDYPRIIRADIDEWNPKMQEEHYKSPVARFIYSYLKHISSQGDGGSFKHGKVSNARTFKSLIRFLHGLLKDFRQGEDHKYDLTNLASKGNIQSIWKNGEQAPDINDLRGRERMLFKSLLLANYLCKRLCVARIEMRKAPERSYAIFERLNMTGAALNAFEAFKPYVVRELGEEYEMEDCAQRKNIERIEEGYVGIKNRKTSDSHVAELIVSMALAYSGEKLGSSTQKQHEHLSSTYAFPVEQEETNQYEYSKERKDKYKDFLYCFRTVSDMKMMFEAEKDGITSFLDSGTGLEKGAGLKKYVDKATFCLQFLKAANFKITVALLSVYLHQVREQKDSKSIRDFCSIVCKTAAFCALWRSFFKTTNNIDAKIRDIFQPAQSMKLRDFYYGGQEKPGDGMLSAKDLGQHFINVLQANQITDLTTWRKEVTDREIYEIKQVARFILLVGSHRMDFEKEGSKKLILRRDGPDLITRNGFHDPSVNSIEHIIPVKERDGSKNQQENKRKNQLWNLTLVPVDINKILSNRAWKHKRIFYRYYSAATDKEQKQCLAELSEDERASKEFKRFKKSDPGYLPMIKYLAKLGADDFTAKEGKHRTEAILNRCWEILADWLEWEDANVK